MKNSSWNLARLVFALLMAVSVMLASVACSRSDSTDSGEARIVFAGMPDGQAPQIFGDGATVVNTDPANDTSSKLRVVEGKLTNSPAINAESAGLYTSGSLGGPVTNIGARWTFTPHAGTSDSAVVLVVSQSGVHHPIPMHLVIGPTQWSLGIYAPDTDGSAPRETLAWGIFDPPLRQASQNVLEAQAWLAGARVELQLPDGTRRVVNDPRVAQWPGNFATFEAYYKNGLTDARIGFTEIWARSSSV